MRIFELFGAPGAGKSTLSKSAECLIETRYKIWTRNELINTHPSKACKIYDSFLAVLTDPFFAFTVYKFSMSYGLNLTNLTYATRLIKLDYLIQKKKKNACSNDIILLDEGYIQHITSMPNDIKLKRTRNYYALIKQTKRKLNGAKFFYCEVNQDLAVERLIKRNQEFSTRISKLPHDQLKRNIAIRIDNLRQLIADLEIIDLVKVIDSS